MSPYVICIFKLESVLDKMQNKSANFIHLTEMLHILKVLESNLHAGVLMPEKNPLLLGSETRPPWADILPTTLKKVLHVPVIKRKMRVQPWCIAWFHLRTVLKLGFQIILQFFIDFKCFKKRYSWNTIGKECLFMIRKIVDSWMYRYLLEDKVVVRRLQLEYLDESSKLFELLPSYISALDTGNYKEWKNMITSQSWEQYILHRTNGCSICQSEEDLMYFYTCGHISCNNCWTSMQQQNEEWVLFFEFPH